MPYPRHSLSRRAGLPLDKQVLKYSSSAQRVIISSSPCTVTAPWTEQRDLDVHLLPACALRCTVRGPVMADSTKQSEHEWLHPIVLIFIVLTKPTYPRCIKPFRGMRHRPPPLSSLGVLGSPYSDVAFTVPGAGYTHPKLRRKVYPRALTSVMPSSLLVL